MKNTFPKSQRLSGRKVTSALFSTGKGFSLFPFRVVWMKVEPNTEPIQVLFSIPKRKFKRAVHRNKIRRRLKEAFRLNKLQITELLREKGVNIIVAVIYTGNEAPEWKEAEDKIILTLQRLIKEVFQEPLINSTKNEN